MPIIKNALWNAQMVDLEGRAIRLEPRGTADISDGEVQSAGLQTHLRLGDVYLLPQTDSPDKKTKGKG